MIPAFPEDAAITVPGYEGVFKRVCVEIDETSFQPVMVMVQVMPDGDLTTPNVIRVPMERILK